MTRQYSKLADMRGYKIGILKGWKYSIPVHKDVWFVDTQWCADGLRLWLEAAIQLQQQGMGARRARRWWHNAVEYNLDGTPKCTDALDSEPREEAFVVIWRVGWILRGAPFFEGVRLKSGISMGSRLDAHILSGEAEEARFYKLNQL